MIKQKRFRKFMAMIIALAMITIVTPFSASAAKQHSQMSLTPFKYLI